MTGQLSDKKELTWQEWEKMENDNTVLVDLREEVVYHHGSIPGAVCIPLRCFAEEKEKLPKDKCIVVFCQRGEKSLQVVEELRKEGRKAYHLEGGFLRWLIDHAKEVNMERYSRHVLLDEVGQEGQEKLLASKVLVVGAGGLGAPVALYLAAAGVGTIGIVDADEVDLSNLQRQIIHGTADVGKAKVKSAKETMNAMNPDVEVKTYRMFVDSSNIRELVREYDFIIDGTDNFPAKFLINDACVLEKKPFSHAGIIRFKGQLMTYVPGEGPCYRCVFKNPPPKDAVPTCKQAGVIGAMGGVIGSLQAMEAIKYLIGVGDLLTGYLLTFDALTMEFHKVKLPKDTHDCAVCGDHPTILEPIDYEQEVCEETAGRFATRDEQ